MADVSMRILLSAVGGSSVVSSIGQVASALGSGGLGTALLGIGVAAVGFGAASVKMAADYQQSMNRVQALTGSSQQQMSQYDDGLKQLAVNAGVAPKALADGLYNVISAGYSGAGAMKVLTLATEDAKIGMTDSTTTTQALTNVMANFKVGVSGANVVNGEMLETVTLGKATFAQYASSITKAASTSAQYSETMQTMNAAWATLTSSGISAGMATTDYDQSLKVMDGNIGTVVKSLNKNGIAFNETAFNAMDYGHKVVYLNNALQEARNKHVMVTGATVQATQAIKTISDHIGVYNNDLATLSNKSAMAAKTQQAWAITQNGFNQQMSRVNAAVQVLMINIGTQLLPVLTGLLNSVAPIITTFANWVGSGHAVSDMISWFKDNLQLAIPILSALGVVLLSVILPALGSMAVAVTAIDWPLLLIIGVVAALAAGLVFLYNNVKWVHDAIDAFGKGIQNVFHSLQTQIGQAMTAIHRDTEEHTLQMKAEADQHTIDMAHKSIANIESMKAGIESQMMQAQTASQRHMLQIKLDALNQSEQEQKGVIANATKQREGVQAQLAQLDPVTRLHTLAAKDTALKNTLAMDVGSVTHLSAMRANIENEMLHAHSAVTRHSLGMQIDAIDAAIKQKTGVIAQVEQQRGGIEKSMSATRKIIEQDNNNVVLRALGVWQSFQNGVSQAGAAIWKILQQIGNYLGSVFAPVWKQLVDEWNSQLLPLFKQLGIALQQLMPVFKLVGGIILGLLAVAFGILIGLIGGIVKAFAGWLSGLIVAVGGVVRLFTGMAQVLGGIVQFVIDLFTFKWSKLGGDLKQIWGGIVNMFLGGLQMIKGIFQSGLGIVTGLVSGFVDGIRGFFTMLWNDLVGHSIVPDMINGIVNWFEQLPGRVGAFVQSLLTGVLGIFNSLASEAIAKTQQLIEGVVNWFKQAPGLAANALSSIPGIITNVLSNAAGAALSGGANIVNAIANGIRGAISNVGSAIGSVTQFISDHLPHSPAKIGPLTTLPQVGPEIVMQISDGMVSAAPYLQSALGQVLTPLTTPGTFGIPSLSSGGADSGVLADQLSFTHAPTTISSGKKAPVKTTAEKKREAAQLKNAEKTDASDFKAVDAEINSIKKQEALKIKHEQAVYTAQIKAIEARDKGLKGSAKKIEEEEIKAIRAREKTSIASQRKSFAAKVKADKTQEAHLKQEIHLNLTVHATKLDAAEVDKLSQHVIQKFGDQIRSQFANV